MHTKQNIATQFTSIAIHKLVILTRVVLRSSDWIRHIYKSNDTELYPYRVTSLITILRLAGHKRKTLLSDFKDRRGMNITETLKDFLDSKNTTEGNLSGIASQAG